MAVKEQADKDGIPFRYLQVNIYLQSMLWCMYCLTVTLCVCSIRVFLLLSKLFY